MKGITFSFFAVLSFFAVAQKPVVLIDTPFRIVNAGANSYDFYLAEGDSIVFDLSILDAERIDRFTFAEYKGDTLLNLKNISGLTNTHAIIKHEGIYNASLHYNGFLSGDREGRFKILRYYSATSGPDFATTVTYVTGIDTVWYKEMEKTFVGKDTLTDMILMTTAEVGCKKNNRRTKIDFTLPDSINCWAVCISVGQDGDMIYNGITESLSDTSPIVRNHGLMTYLALGKSYIPYINDRSRPSLLAGLDPDSNHAERFVKGEKIKKEDFLRQQFNYYWGDNSLSGQHFSLLLYNDTHKKTTAFVYISSVRIRDVVEWAPVMKFKLENRLIPVPLQIKKGRP